MNKVAKKSQLKKASKIAKKKKLITKKAVQISSFAQVKPNPSVEKQTAKTLKEERKLKKSAHQQFKHDVKRSVEKMGVTKFDSRQAKNVAKSGYIAENALKNTGKAISSIDRQERNDENKQAANAALKVAYSLNSAIKVHRRQNNVANSAIANEELVDNFDEYNSFENVILNYIIKD